MYWKIEKEVQVEVDLVMYDDIIVKAVANNTENVSQAMLDIFSIVTEAVDYEVVEIPSDRVDSFGAIAANLCKFRYNVKNLIMYW